MPIFIKLNCHQATPTISRRCC